MAKVNNVGRKGLPIETLPYAVKVYINNQVLVPASIVRRLGLERTKYAYVVLEYNNQKIELTNVRLLGTRHTDSRQFTIPREVREKYGIKPFDTVIIHVIKPTAFNTRDLSN